MSAFPKKGFQRSVEPMGWAIFHDAGPPKGETEATKFESVQIMRLPLGEDVIAIGLPKKGIRRVEVWPGNM